MKKSRVFSFVAGLMAAAMALTACGGAPASSTPPASGPASQSAEAEPVTITYCNFNSAAGNEETLQNMYEAVSYTHLDVYKRQLLISGPRVRVPGSAPHKPLSAQSGQWLFYASLQAFLIFN